MNKYNENNAQIGARIRKLRDEKDLTQEQLAELSDICSPQQVSNVERGMAGLSIARFAEICKVLDASADYLLFGLTPEKVETDIHKYIEKMTNEQAANLLEIVKLYAEACGIKEI